MREMVNEDIESIKEELLSVLSEDIPFKDYLRQFLLGSSKRIRSTVAILYLRAQNKNLSKSVIKLLAVGEIIHNASLLHDDVIDDADKRRGKSTLNKSESPHVSILLGDFLLAFATKKLLEMNNNQILDIFLNCTKDMCNSEMKQYLLRGKTPTLEEYINICRGKTAKLFEAIFESCAIMENLDKYEACTFAKNFGILFQLKNDIQKDSAEVDKKNKIYTPQNFLGIEKTLILIDNYRERVRECIVKLPDNDYKKELGVLVEKL